MKWLETRRETKSNTRKERRKNKPFSFLLQDQEVRVIDILQHVKVLIVVQWMRQAKHRRKSVGDDEFHERKKYLVYSEKMFERAS